MWGLVAVCLLMQVPSADEELQNHINKLAREVEDESRPLLKRVGVLLDLAATLDRSAQAESDRTRAIAYWQDAVGRLDEFVRKNQKGEKDPTMPLRLQAGVYVWAQARTWFDQVPDNPADPEPARKAKAFLDDARERLEKLLDESKELPLIQDNGRFRLAQVLTDLSVLADSDRDRRRELEEQAEKRLEAPFEEPGVSGYAALLRADLLRRLGRVEEAHKVVEEMENRAPKPPEAARVPVEIGVLIARNRCAEAITRIDGTMLDEAEKARLRVKVRLSQRSRLNPGPERGRVENDAIKEAEPLRGRDDRPSRQALVDLATAIDMPGLESPAGAFPLLAEGHQLAHRTERAADLLGRGADRALAEGESVKAAELRMRAGALLFRDAKFVEAEPHFQKVVDDPKAGPARAKASLFVALGREQGLNARPPTGTQRAYVAALENHLKAFPDDMTSGEVRWRLGGEYRRIGKVDEASKLWAAIPSSDDRWYDVRTRLARELEENLLRTLPAGDTPEARAAAEALRAHLKDSRDKAPTPELSAEFALRSAAAELLPGVGRPDRVLMDLEEFLDRPSSAQQKLRAKFLLVVARATAGRVVEAESLARAEAKTATAQDLVEPLRLLDRAASEADSDLNRMRDAAIMKILVTPIAARPKEIPEGLKPELVLRQARAFAMAGELSAAKSTIGAATFNPEGLGDETLRDLADLYMRLEGYSLAIDVQRLRARRLRPGTGAWFESRYGLATAYYRSKRPDDAREIIDGTAILHPSLGGGSLKGKFERLRSRIGER